MQGQPFFDTDYTWIRVAKERTWLDLTQKIFLPTKNWEFEDRPGMQVFLKIFDSISTWNPIPMLVFKCVIFVGTMISITFFGFTLREPISGLVAAILWASTSNTLCSMFWFNDMAIWIQLIGICGTLLVLRWIRHSDLSYFQWLWEASIFTVFVVFSFSVKGNARLFPVIWSLGWFFTGRVKPYRFIPWFVLLWIYTVSFDYKLPFLPSSQIPESHLIQPARLSQMIKLTFSDAFSTTMEPQGFLGAIGPVFWIFGIAGLVLLMWRAFSGIKNKKKRIKELFLQISKSPYDGLIFLCIWISLTIVSYSSYPDNPMPLSSRYAEAPLGSGSIILSFGLIKLMRILIISWENNKWFFKIIIFTVFCIVGVQLIFNVKRTINIKNDVGAEIVSGQIVRASANNKLSNTLVIYFNALDNGGVDSSAGNEFIQYPTGVPLKKDWVQKQLSDRAHLKGVAFITLFNATFIDMLEQKKTNIIEIDRVPCLIPADIIWSRFFSTQPSKYFILYRMRL